MGSEKITPPEQLAEVRQRALGLFEEYEDFIRALVRFAVRDPSDREDFFQDLFLSFLLSPPAGEIRSPKGFFYRLVLERARDWHRSRARKQKSLQKFYQRASIQWEEKPADAAVSDADEIAVFFEKVRSHLQTKEGRAVLYRYQYRYSLKEIALRLGVKPETAARYVSSGLKKIRKLFHKKEG